jgi:hypothetical protein
MMRSVSPFSRQVIGLRVARPGRPRTRIAVQPPGLGPGTGSTPALCSITSMFSPDDVP